MHVTASNDRTGCLLGQMLDLAIALRERRRLGARDSVSWLRRFSRSVERQRHLRMTPAARAKAAALDAILSDIESADMQAPVRGHG